MNAIYKLTSTTATVYAILFVLCLADVQGNTLNTSRFWREVKLSKSTPQPSICHGRTPCGWSVYIPFTKEIDYYMPNTCVCEEELDCIRTENDISISAYVHRCREKPHTTEKYFK